VTLGTVQVANEAHKAENTAHVVNRIPKLNFDTVHHQNGCRENAMRTTVTIDDTLYQKALEMADPDMDKTEIFREAMKTFVRIQAAKRLAALGGTLPEMADIPRERGEAEQPA